MEKDKTKPKRAGARDKSGIGNDTDPKILFPMETTEENSRIKKGFRWFKVFLGLVLIVVAFFLGYGTRPEVMDQWLATGKKWAQTGVEKTRPLGRRIYERTEEVVEAIRKKPQPTVEKIKAPVMDKVGKVAERKIKFWRAPMDPGYISDKPGKSPMGMDLVPVYENEGEEGVSISPTVVQNIGVKTEVVRKRSLRREIRTVGRLTYDERLVHHIHTKYGGWIDKLHVDFTGQEVKKDDMLLEIYSPDLVSTQEELVLALKYQDSLKGSAFPEIIRGADSLVDSTRKRLELFDVPPHQIEELIQTKKVKKTMHIHSPVKGFVVKKKAQRGIRVEPGMSLYMIADLSNIWALVDIYEYEIPWIKLGQEAVMTLSYYPGKQFKGTVTYIDPFLDPESRTLKVRMEFANPEWKLKPDMYANVILKSEIIRKGVAVPKEAVIYSGEKTVVIVQTDSGQFKSREVVLGVEAKGYIQVLKGIKSGERVVTSSTFLIDSESRLQEALGKMEKPRGWKKNKDMGLMKKKKQKKVNKTIILQEDRDHP
jgi:multidrug efflux pump subunit AcrA (membrane-fusion protein)